MKANVGTMVRAAKCKTIDITTPITLEAYVEFIVRDKDGRIAQYRRKKAESFVRQFIDLLYVKMAGLINLAGKYYPVLDYTNTSRNVYSGIYSFATLDGTITDVTKGIIIGTGPNAVTISDYKLQTPIAHATMNYSAVTFGAPTDDGTTSQFRITRDFSNVSGGSVTVEECALYGYDQITGTYMIARDVTGGIAVPNGQTLTLNYQIQATIANYLVRGFIQHLYSLMSGIAMSMLDIGNASRLLNFSRSYGALGIYGTGGLCTRLTPFTSMSTGDATYTGDDLGLVVGSGTAAVASTDYKLNTKIAHGLTSGTQLLHAGTEVDIPVISAPTANFKIRRYFYNGSGAPVTVKEAGIYVPYAVLATTVHLFLIARKLTGDVAVLDTELLKVEWTFQVST